MDWKALRKYVPVLVGILVVGSLLIWLNRSSFDSDIKDTVQDSEKAISLLKGKAQKIEADIKATTLELEQKQAGIDAKNETIATREKEIIELKGKLKKIPERSEPFKKLEACQAEYTALRIEYTGRGKLIVSLGSQVLDYGQLKLDYRSSLKNHREITRLNEKLKEGHTAEIVEKDRIIKAYKKKRAPLFSLVIGGGIGLNGRPFIGIAGGINITGILKRLF